jgi:hypothetical protein
MSDALNKLLGRSSQPPPGRAGRAGEIADLTRVTLALEQQAAVTVQQLACAEPGCPPIETKIMVLGEGAGRRWTIHAPVSEVDDETVLRILIGQPEGENAPQ